MFVYGLSKKQCGVIFGAIKRGEVNPEAEDFIRWMYDRVADAKCFRDDSKTADVYSRMRSALDAFFAGDKAECEEKCNQAYNVWHCYFAEA